MKLDHVNVYALDNGDGWTLIDTGMATTAGRAALRAALDGPLAGKPVTRVVVTHHHPDHVGLAGGLMAQGAELLIPRTAYLIARMLVLDEQDVAPPESVAFYRAAGLEGAALDRYIARRPFNFADVVEPLPLGFRDLPEGGMLKMGGRTWDIRLGGGHAIDHATFWCREEPLVLGGDQLLPGISPNLGVHPTEPEADPVADWIAACRRLAPFATEDQLILPGHKLPYRGLPFRLRQMEENHHSALARLRNHLAEPRTAIECFPALFRRRIGEGEFGLALVEAVAHCNHLWLAGEASRTRRGDAWVYSTA
ncbi:MBL fold metallo-hydrolase [Pelagovum pacificum]|uniref:MBL fold metallo-hydrolase n=2 Tax=Pelagovum pacificum TaxID=2588711 RepID=A0A5C5GIN2_9RHOB|nr:MBL fold metallo-hydrolase [Pelagovum pacificum]TNY34370.1 MBL fold metallo-hydrolase [Pelagovum pacificum]